MFERGFPDSEYEARADRAQRMMADASIDALLFMTPPEFTYFTGFQSNFWQSPTRPWFLVLPASGKPIAVVPSIGENALSMSWIERSHIWASPNPDDEGISLVSSVLNGLAARHGRIGIPLGPETHLRMPANDADKLRAALAPHDIVDATQILRNLRAVKSEREIAKQAYVCDLVSSVYQDADDLFAGAQTERDIIRHHRRAILQRGADTASYIIAAAAPGGSDDAIRFPTDRALQKGDVLFVDTGAEVDGYYCDFDRNFAIGAPASQAAQTAYRLAHRATDAGIAAALPGARACDVFAAMWSVLEAGGATGGSVGRMGHGVGLQNTEGLSLRPGDTTPLVPGMVLAIEPGYDFAPGKMMLHEENIVVREGGAQLLTRRAPPELPVLTLGR